MVVGHIKAGVLNLNILNRYEYSSIVHCYSHFNMKASNAYSFAWKCMRENVCQWIRVATRGREIYRKILIEIWGWEARQELQNDWLKMIFATHLKWFENYVEICTIYMKSIQCIDHVVDFNFTVTFRLQLEFS